MAKQPDSAELELQAAQIEQNISGKLKRHFGKTVEDATVEQIYQACAMTVRDEIMDHYTATQEALKSFEGKRLYYLSVEFLMGRALSNNIMNLEKTQAYRLAMRNLGLDMDEVLEREPDAGLGNGGLGRLAACFLDSLSTMELPVMGCGIRYEYGLFRQRIVDGYQVEMPDTWLENGNAWEILKNEDTVEVHFGGRIEEDWSGEKMVIHHVDYNTVNAVPYDVPILGYDSKTTGVLRLWSAKSPTRIDMGYFNRGDYIRASEEKELSETISKVLYPEDNNHEGKLLRLKQHYFFVSATMQYALNTFKKQYGTQFHLLPEKIAVHINDTHPGLAIPELMRLLMDEEGLGWEEAQDICRRVFAYTNHTVMGEALERWPEQMFRELIPRIHTIVTVMNERYCQYLWQQFPGQWDRISAMAIIGYGEVRMANLCVAMGHSVNGVSALHTEILKSDTFKDFYALEPQKFCSITNGVTHRRWLKQANPRLAELVTEAIGPGWITQPDQLARLKPFADDPAFRERFAAIKRANKARMADHIRAELGVAVDPDSIFDVQAKRLHEYKRQLLNCLHILYLYDQLVENPNLAITPQTFLFAAKAAPGYHRAKLIIKLINAIAELIDNHPATRGKIKVAFLPNYSVSLAEKLMPAADISEQISTAGKEASGTGNMKFMLNGAITLGTLDGANVEILEQVGPQNIFIFGLTAPEVDALFASGGYRSVNEYETNAALRRTLDHLIDGTLCPDQPRLFSELYQALLFGDNGGMADPYLLLKDFASYAHTHELCEAAYRDADRWQRMAVLNTASCGVFSSDRTIADYNRLIWHLEPLKL